MNTLETTTKTIVDTFVTTEEQRQPKEAKTFEYELKEEKNGRTYRTTSSLFDWD